MLRRSDPRSVVVALVLLGFVALAATATAQTGQTAVGIRMAPPEGADPLTIQDIETTQETDFTVRPSGAALGEQTLELVVFCFDVFTGEILPFCDVELTLDPVPFSGGHEHHDADRPGGEFDPSSGNTGADGLLETTYTSPEVSGVVIATVNGSTQGGPVVPGTASIGVEIGGLVGLAVQGDGYFVQASDDHGNNNRFATPSARDDLAEIPVAFRQDLREQGVAEGDLPTLIYTGVCLPQGGLFDIGSTFWTTPHKSHRFGTDADLFTSKEDFVSVRDEWLDTLETVILNQTGFYFPVEDEAPGGTANHWHLRVR